MNENIDLTKILKDCPKGTKLYSTIFGEVELCKIEEDEDYPIVIETITDQRFRLVQDGRHSSIFDGECTLFPSKEQRDWSKFTIKRPKFNPKTLKPFDRILARNGHSENWNCDIFSNIYDNESYKYNTVSNYWKYCIPYNDETKHLAGTTDDAPEFYRY